MEDILKQFPSLATGGTIGFIVIALLKFLESRLDARRVDNKTDYENCREQVKLLQERCDKLIAQIDEMQEERTEERLAHQQKVHELEIVNGQQDFQIRSLKQSLEGYKFFEGLGSAKLMAFAEMLRGEGK